MDAGRELTRLPLGEMEGTRLLLVLLRYKTLAHSRAMRDKDIPRTGEAGVKAGQIRARGMP